MAQNKTLASIVDKVRSYADLIGNDFRTDAQIAVFVQARAERFREEVMRAGGHRWLATPASVSTVAGVQTVALPASGAVQVLAVDILLSGSDWVPLDEVPFDERYAHGTTPKRPEAWYPEGDRVCLLPMPDAVYSLRVWYTPVQPTIVDGGAIPVPFDAIHGWDEYLAWAVAADLKGLQELDASYQSGRAAEELRRIKVMLRSRTVRAGKVVSRRYGIPARRSVYVR